MAHEREHLEQGLKVLTEVANTVKSALRELQAEGRASTITVWRLMLECGHLRLDGPWDADEPQRYMIGDMTFCEICPRRETHTGKVMLVRQVVNVERVPGGQYREPKPEADAERREGLGQ